MLFHQARQGKKGLYLTTLSEPSLKLINYMQQFSFFDERLIADKRVIIADLGSVMRRKGVDETLAEIIGRVEREEPAIVVIDSFKALRDLLGDAPAMRTFIYDLAVHVASWGAASLFVGEYTRGGDRDLLGVRHRRRHHPARQPPRRAAGDSRGRGPEAARRRRRDRRSLLRDHRRRAGVLPARAQPGRPVPDPEGLDARTPTGVAGLDEMLGGGLPRASATVVQGGTGTGKTLLGLQFLLEGARHGEPGIHFALEETREPAPSASPRCSAGISARSRSAGSSPSATSRPSSSRPIASSTRRGDEVARLGARRAVLDSLTSMALGVPSERRFKELVYAITKHFRAAGVTST